MPQTTEERLCAARARAKARVGRWHRTTQARATGGREGGRSKRRKKAAQEGTP